MQNPLGNIGKIVAGLLFILIFTMSAAAETPLWNFKNVKWYAMMENGNLLAATPTALVCLDGANGTQIWQRPELKDIREDEYHALEGTPFLLVADNTGWAQRKTKLYAIDLQSGETVWETDKLLGFTAQVSPLYDKNMLIFLTIRDNRVNKDKPDITALKLSTGELLWNAEYTEKVDLYGVEKTKKSGFASSAGGFMGIGGDSPRYDLSGENDPVFDADSMYLTYAGLHRYDLATGKLLWKMPYDVTEGSLKRTNAPAIVDGETIITSARGIVRAFDKNSGAQKWTTKDLNKGGIAETIVHQNVVYGRLGGVFYSHKKKEYEPKKPIGVVALDKNSGNVLWEYKGAKNSITNMVLLAEQNQLLIADDKNLIAIDTNSTGKVKEAFKLKLEFKTKLGMTGVATKVVKGIFGGIGGIVSGGEDTTDEPVSLVKHENGTIIARGKQHILAFNPKNKDVQWSTYYAAPGIPAWQKIAMTAITAYVSGIVAQDKANANANFYNGSGSLYESNAADKRFQSYWSSYGAAMSKRYSATKQQGNFVYVLTKVKSGAETGTGLIGVNLTEGNGVRQILLDDKKPDYEVDEATGRVFNLDDKQIVAYNITEAVQLETNDDDGKKKKDKKKN